MVVRIVTDSACDLPPELERELHDWNVRTIPFVFHFGQESMVDKTMPMQTFLARALQQWPTTATPAYGLYASAFQEIVSAGDQALCITITGRHSGACDTARSAAREFPGQVAVVDSRSLSLGEGFLALAAVRAARAQATLEQIVDTLQDMVSRIRFFIGLDTLDYVVRGGRASRMAGVVASILQLRPIITVEDGYLVLKDKPRTRRRCLERLLTLAEEILPADALGVMHAAAEDEAHALAQRLAEITGHPLEAIPVVEVGMALATHSGPGGIGIAAVRSIDSEDRERRFTILGRELPRFELPRVDLPHIELPHLPLPRRRSRDDDEPDQRH
ncbi:MAG: DegV family protein [Anaerolineae bacterium]|jgi:DegV family protein with EDD domain